VLLIACGGAAVRSARHAPVARPAVITDGTYTSIRRHYDRLPPGARGRADLRGDLGAYLLRDAQALLDADDYDGVVERIVTVTSLGTPAELGAGDLPAELRPLAKYLIEHGTPRGDEARVLTGTLIVSLLQDRGESRKLYERILGWSLDSRAALSEPLGRFSEGLLPALEEHVRMLPTPETMDLLTKMQAAHRDAALHLIQSSERSVPPQALFLNWQHTPFEVAAVYLRHGDPSSALSRVKAMGNTSKLVDWLSIAREDNTEGASALISLAAKYLRRSTNDVAKGICVSGMRRFPGDVRFLSCLAHVAASDQDHENAIAWHAEAIELMPDERAIYDEALRDLSTLIGKRLTGEDPPATRMLANEATRILEQRMVRWSDTPPPVTPEQLYRDIAVAEMNAGNAREAEQKLLVSIGAKETVDAHRQLAVLLERMGRPEPAAQHYRSALSMLDDKNLRDVDTRAELLERLGDVLRLDGDANAAAGAYAQSLSLWDGLMSRLHDRNVGVAQLHRGILLGRLAREDQALEAFGLAMSAAPEVRETYGTILAYLVVAQPDAGFAHRVFRQAVNQLSLDSRWKVYFALWLRLVASREGVPTDQDVTYVLQDLADADDWPGALAAFGCGQLTYPQLLERADNLGERTEAHFYEGARLLGAGDEAGASAKFQQVLDTQMINFYEFTMAQELLRAGSGAGPTVSPAAAAKAETKAK